MSATLPARPLPGPQNERRRYVEKGRKNVVGEESSEIPTATGNKACATSLVSSVLSQSRLRQRSRCHRTLASCLAIKWKRVHASPVSSLSCQRDHREVTVHCVPDICSIGDPRLRQQQPRGHRFCPFSQGQLGAKPCPKDAENRKVQLLKDALPVISLGILFL